MSELNNIQSNNQGNTQNTGKGDLLYCVCGFFLPIVGLILWLVWRNGTEQQQLDAKQAAIGGLVGFSISILFYVFIFIIMIAGASSTTTSYL